MAKFDFDKFEEKIKQKAKENDPKAMYQCVIHGVYDNAEEKELLFSKSVEMEWPYAMEKMGDICLNKANQLRNRLYRLSEDEKSEIDTLETSAKEWYSKAAVRYSEVAAKGIDKNAYYSLGEMYLEGKKIPLDIDKAIENFKYFITYGKDYRTDKYVAALTVKKINDYITKGKDVTKPLIVWLSSDSEETLLQMSSSFDLVKECLDPPALSGITTKYFAHHSEGHPYKQGHDYFIDSDGETKKIADHPELFEKFETPDYNSNTDYFLYYRYTDQLCPEHLSYCQDIIDHLHKPVVCLLVNVKDKGCISGIIKDYYEIDFNDLYNHELGLD